MNLSDELREDSSGESVDPDPPSNINELVLLNLCLGEAETLCCTIDDLDLMFRMGALRVGLLRIFPSNFLLFESPNGVTLE